jgi:hypothetical protein
LGSPERYFPVLDLVTTIVVKKCEGYHYFPSGKQADRYALSWSNLAGSAGIYARQVVAICPEESRYWEEWSEETIVVLVLWSDAMLQCCLLLRGGDLHEILS